MCYVATTPAGAFEALVPDKSLTPRQRRTSQRAQAAIFRNDESLFVQLLPLLDLSWRAPTTQHTLLTEAVIRLRVRMVRMLCHRMHTPLGFELRSEALIHLLQSWPAEDSQALAYQACLAALLGDDSLGDFPVLPETIGWLNLAVATDNPVLVELLLDLGAPLAGCRPTGGNLLHAVTESDAHSLLPWSLERGVDPNGVDEVGETPLHIAARCGNLATLIELVAAGGSLEAANTVGETPLAFFDNLGEAGWAWYHQRKALQLNATLGPASAATSLHQRF